MAISVVPCSKEEACHKTTRVIYQDLVSMTERSGMPSSERKLATVTIQESEVELCSHVIKKLEAFIHFRFSQNGFWNKRRDLSNRIKLFSQVQIWTRFLCILATVSNLPRKSCQALWEEEQQYSAISETQSATNQWVKKLHWLHINKVNIVLI